MMGLSGPSGQTPYLQSRRRSEFLIFLQFLNLRNLFAKRTQNSFAEVQQLISLDWIFLRRDIFVIHLEHSVQFVFIQLLWLRSVLFVLSFSSEINVIQLQKGENQERKKIAEL